MAHAHHFIRSAWPVSTRATAGLQFTAPGHLQCWESLWQREKGNKAQANAVGQSGKIRRDTWILKQGRCSSRCCSAAATPKQSTWSWAAVQPPQPCCCPRWHLHPLLPLLSHSHHSSSAILSIHAGRALSFTGGMEERSRRLCLSLLQETYQSFQIFEEELCQELFQSFLQVASSNRLL